MTWITKQFIENTMGLLTVTAFKVYYVGIATDPHPTSVIASIIGFSLALVWYIAYLQGEYRALTRLDNALDPVVLALVRDPENKLDTSNIPFLIAVIYVWGGPLLAILYFTYHGLF